MSKISKNRYERKRTENQRKRTKTTVFGSPRGNPRGGPVTVSRSHSLVTPTGGSADNVQDVFNICRDVLIFFQDFLIRFRSFCRRQSTQCLGRSCCNYVSALYAPVHVAGLSSQDHASRLLRGDAFPNSLPWISWDDETRTLQVLKFQFGIWWFLKNENPSRTIISQERESLKNQNSSRIFQEPEVTSLHVRTSKKKHTTTGARTNSETKKRKIPKIR